MKLFHPVAVVLLCWNGIAVAQSGLGIWEGKLPVATPLRLVLHVARDSSGAGLTASMDSPDQGVMGIEAASASQAGDSLTVSWPAMNAVYHARVSGDTALQGSFVQRDHALPLTLSRTETPSTLNRPQTPQPPFPYKTEDVLYYNADKSIQYGATLTIPKGKGPFPAILLISGSGQQNRDEEIFSHKPFLLLADYLTKRGYLVMRVDDRGTGKTTGAATLAKATSYDFAGDAETSLDFLKKRKEVNTAKLGLYGHSEGGMIAEMLAAKRDDIAFIVLAAAPGIPAKELMAEQNELVMRSMGRKKEDAASFGRLFRLLAQDIITAKDSSTARAAMRQSVAAWRLINKPELVTALTGISDSLTTEAYITQFVQLYSNAWYRSFLQYDPTPYLKKIKAKVLAVDGSLDIQVASASNLAGINMALAQSPSKGYKTTELPGLNHLFQKCKKCSAQEYAQLEETLNPALLDAVGEWLDKEVGK